MKRSKLLSIIRDKRGMEMVQVAILVAIAVTIGLIFKSEITDFVNETFGSLSKASFRRKLAQRSGSIYVEASMVMPLTCLVMAGLIAVIMSFTALSPNSRKIISNRHRSGM